MEYWKGRRGRGEEEIEEEGGIEWKIKEREGEKRTEEEEYNI
jgi:hypothetical protein